MADTCWRREQAREAAGMRRRGRRGPRRRAAAVVMSWEWGAMACDDGCFPSCPAFPASQSPKGDRAGSTSTPVGRAVRMATRAQGSLSAVRLAVQ